MDVCDDRAAQDRPQYLVMLPPTDNQAKIDLALIWALLRSHWWLLIICSAIAGGGAAVYALSKPNIYRATAVVAVRSGDARSLQGQVNSQLGGLASLAGVNLSSGGGERNELIAALSSRELAERFLRGQRIFGELFWDKRDANGAWKGKPPTFGEAIDRWREDFISISEDRKSGLVSISVEDIDRRRAARWVNAYVDLANRMERARQIREANDTITYLRGQIGLNALEGVRQGLYQLIESNINRAALASISKDHPFAFVDHAAAPEPKRKVRPKRSAIVAIAAILGSVVAALGILARNWRKIIAKPIRSAELYPEVASHL